jgi:hypothetical protein
MASDMEREVEKLARLLNSFSDKKESVDLSKFKLIEELDDHSWRRLKGFRRIKRLKLPPSLLTVRQSAVSERRQLTDVTLPCSLRSIEDGAFAFCYGLAIRDLKLPASLKHLGERSFSDCHALTGKLSTHITGVRSFADCRGLTSLDLDSCITEIVVGCFLNCIGLTELELPSSLQIIGAYAFCNCKGLTDRLIIPPFVSFIGKDAFKGCTGMTGIEQAIVKHFTSFESWKARGNVLMTLIRFDEEYRRVVEKKGGRLGGDLSNAFFFGFSNEAQLIYKAAAHVDGTDNLANGISRLIHSFLPMNRRYYGTMLSNDEVDAALREGEDESDSDIDSESDGASDNEE